jgi:uncharacterized membrane protein YfcA
VSKCATRKNQGVFNSVFFAVFMTSQVVGNSLGAFIVQYVRQSVFFIVLAGFVFVAAFWFLCLPDVKEADVERLSPRQNYAIAKQDSAGSSASTDVSSGEHSPTGGSPTSASKMVSKKAIK